jgi:hypothetical protein
MVVWLLFGDRPTFAFVRFTGLLGLLGSLVQRLLLGLLMVRHFAGWSLLRFDILFICFGGLKLTSGQLLLETWRKLSRIVVEGRWAYRLAGISRTIVPKCFLSTVNKCSLHLRIVEVVLVAHLLNLKRGRRRFCHLRRQRVLSVLISPRR